MQLLLTAFPRRIHWLGAVHRLCRLKIGKFWPPPPIVVFFIKWGLCSKSSLGLPPSPYRDDIVHGRPLRLLKILQLFFYWIYVLCHFANVESLSDKKTDATLFLWNITWDLGLVLGQFCNLYVLFMTLFSTIWAKSGLCICKKPHDL